MLKKITGDLERELVISKVGHLSTFLRSTTEKSISSSPPLQKVLKWHGTTVADKAKRARKAKTPEDRKQIQQRKAAREKCCNHRNKAQAKTQQKGKCWKLNCRREQNAANSLPTTEEHFP